MKHRYSITIIAFIGILAAGMNGCHSPQNTTEATTAKGDTATPPAIDSTVTTKPNTTMSADTTPNTTKEPVKSTKPLTVVIENLGSETAPVEISIYGTENKFPSPKDQLKVFRFTPKGPTLTATLPGITYGEYAIATYQDMDGDGKIGKNMIGIPTDPYGFSKNYRPTVKAPNFKDCSFKYDESMNTVSIKMIKK
jgi:uncharacterized protein (DUF2141 family)